MFSLVKRSHISKGGRLTLIRSTLSSMPIFLLSLLCVPRVVRQSLERIQRDYLWGGGALEKKIHLIRWKTICIDKDKGGLGRSLSLLNKAFLNWRFSTKNNSLWKMVITLIYWVEDGGWITWVVRGSYGVGLWKEIKKRKLAC